MNNPKIIKSLAQLKKLASQGDDGVECFISLAGGMVRSSKQIWHDGKKWEIFSSIDGVYNKYTDEQLKIFTNIPEAIKKGALIIY